MNFAFLTILLEMRHGHITTNTVSSNALRQGGLDTTLCDQDCQ